VNYGAATVGGLLRLVGDRCRLCRPVINAHEIVFCSVPSAVYRFSLDEIAPYHYARLGSRRWYSHGALRAWICPDLVLNCEWRFG
jgi:hypothetical protein